jgi:hypothetical protein
MWSAGIMNNQSMLTSDGWEEHDKSVLPFKIIYTSHRGWSDFDGDHTYKLTAKGKSCYLYWLACEFFKNPSPTGRMLDFIGLDIEKLFAEDPETAEQARRDVEQIKPSAKELKPVQRDRQLDLYFPYCQTRMIGQWVARA